MLVTKRPFTEDGVNKEQSETLLGGTSNYQGGQSESVKGKGGYQNTWVNLPYLEV